MTETGNASQGTLETLCEPHSHCEFCADLPHVTATHCRECHASWGRSTRAGHCATCHRTFSTPNVFDLHLLSRGCTDPAGVTRRNGTHVFDLNPRPNPYGTLVWRQPGKAEDDA